MFPQEVVEREFLRVKQESQDFGLFRRAPDSPGAACHSRDLEEVTRDLGSFVASLESEVEPLNQLAVSLLADFRHRDKKHCVLAYVLPQLMAIALSENKAKLLRVLVLSTMMEYPDLLNAEQLRTTLLTLCEMASDHSLEPKHRNFCYFLACKYENAWGTPRYNQADACLNERNNEQVDIAYLRTVIEKCHWFKSANAAELQMEIRKLDKTLQEEQLQLNRAHAETRKWWWLRSSGLAELKLQILDRGYQIQHCERQLARLSKELDVRRAKDV